MSLQLTILMPCLNEAETLATCIRKAHQGAQNANVTSYEVLVSDNGSTDGSQEIARREGARVVHAPVRGYGAALQTGIEEACSKYIIMGDADDSYDFTNITPFIQKLEAGNQLVMGSRFKGEIKPGAMPLLHRYLGNPVLTFIGNLLFNCRLSDFHCGIRAFDREPMLSLNLKTTGMEYASEMVIRATLANFTRSEVPVTLYPDGRSRRPHLRTWSDGWRHLRFMLLYSPRWVFLYPGLLLAFFGFIGMFALLPGALRIGSIVLDVHSMLVSTTVGLAGLQLIFMGVFARTYAAQIGVLPPNLKLERFLDRFSLGGGLFLSVAAVTTGLLLFIAEVLRWSNVGFGPLNYQITLRTIIVGTAALIFGLQLFSLSFIISLLKLRNTSS